MGDVCWFTDKSYNLLRERNAREVDGFANVVDEHRLLLRHFKELSHQHTQLKNEILVLKHGGNASEAGDKGAEQQLQKKIEILQQQLNEKYKNDAHSANSYLTAVSEAKEYFEQLQACQTRVLTLEGELSESFQNEQNLKQELKLATSSAEVLKKELERVRSVLDECEKENRSLNAQNRRLIKQMLEEKAQLIEEMNKMNMLVEQKTGMMGAAATSDEGGVAKAGLISQQHAVIPNAAKHAIKAHATEINCLIYNSSGSMVLTSSSDSTIRMWDTVTAQAKADLRGGGQPIMAVDITVDGDLVLGASNDRACRVWNISTGRVRHTLTGHAGKIYSAKFNVDGKQVVTGGTDRALKIWDLNRGFCTKTLNCRSTSNDLAITHAGQIVSGHQDGAVRFWDLRSQALVHEIANAHSQQVTSVYFSHDGGTKILTNSKDNTLKLYDSRTFNLLNTYSHEEYRTHFSWSKAALSPDGYYIASGSGDGALYVWNVITGNVEKIVSTHSGAIACCQWSNSGNQLASCDKNGFLILWE